MRKLFLAAILVFATIIGARAQFYLAGDDPGHLKWNYIRTPNYKVIYPRGLDSLAVVYARALETNRPRVALSAGYLPGQTYWGATPVVLHAYTPYSNGSVAWAPMRMDLYTLPEAYGPETMPWVQELAIHENRHVAQLQFGADGILKPFTWIFGEAATGLFAGIYPSYWLAEGDAVAAETALSGFGRGRSSDFMAYYMTAFDKGDYRNWEKWRWGSWKRYAPNHYALGYMTVAGGRYLYNDPLFTADYLHLAANRPLKPTKVRAWFKDRSGKSFDAAFKDIMESFHSQWEASAAARGPFDDPSLISAKPKWYTSYSNMAFAADGTLYAVKSSFVSAATLVRITPDGKELTIRPFSSRTSPLATDGDKLWFTETIVDKRWTLAGESNLRVLENGTLRTVTTGKRYYNPAIGPDGQIAVTEYPAEGGSRIVILDHNGNVSRYYDAPDGVQIVESAWAGNRLFVSAIEDEGFELAEIQPKYGLQHVLPGGHCKINHLKSYNGELYFICDKNGVGEVYKYHVPDGVFTQLTNTKYGVTDFAINDKDLYYSARMYEGELLCKAPLRQLKPRPASASEYYTYAVADTLSAQEKRLAEAAGVDLDAEWEGEISAPKKYSKLLNAIRIHSWVPLSIDYDAVSSISADDSYQSLKAGATVLFQNTLGTLSGLASYAHRFGDIMPSEGRNIFHLNLTYTGLYPVIEGSLEVGDRKAIQYNRRRIVTKDMAIERLGGSYLDQPLVDAEVRMYIPFNFSSGGWNRGFIPQVRYVATNDRYNRSVAMLTAGTVSGDFISRELFSGVEHGDNVLMQSLYLSARGYITRPVAHSQVYPSLGVGAELGYHWRVGLKDIYSPQLYGYIYGYLPGLAPEQGLRLSALYQHQYGALRSENAVKTRPRGMAKDYVNNFLALYAPDQLRLTADYAIPFWLGDISALSPLAYIKNFIFTPHADYTFLKYSNGLSGNGGLLSVGADFTVSLANLLWFPFDCEVGLSWSYNGGSAFKYLDGAGVKRNNVGFIFKTRL